MYQYSLTLLQQLASLIDEGRRDDTVVLFTSGDRRPADIGLPDWQWKPIDPPTLRGITLRVAKKVVPQGRLRSVLSKVSSPAGPPNRAVDRADTRKWLQRSGIDLMLYPAPDPRAFEIGIPFIMAIHDLQHRLQPQFPEVGEANEYARREYLYGNAVRAATALLVDSEEGKGDVLDLYKEGGLSPERVHVLPFLPAPYLSQATRRADVGHSLPKLPERFCFYPAQFWPHKNHARLVEAVAQLRDRGVEVPLVLTGTATGDLRSLTHREVMALANRTGVRHLIHWYGYVDDETMAVLYAKATALVFPTFFGPTNIPILEAWSLECPVITSDLRGIREQVGDGGVLVDPSSTTSIAEGILSLWDDEDRRRRFIAAGSKRLAGYTAEDYKQRLAATLDFAEGNLRPVDPVVGG